MTDGTAADGEEATEATEELVAAHWERGADLYEAGRLEEAAAEWRAGLKVHPGHAHLLYLLGLALSGLGQEEEAVSHWREAVRLGPDVYDFAYALAGTLAKRMRADRGAALCREVRRLCRACVALEPPTPAERAYLLRMLAIAEWELGGRRVAIRTMRAAIGVEPGPQWQYERLGRMQARSGDWIGSIRTAVAISRLPGLDLSSYDPCLKRARRDGAVLVGFMGLGAAALFLLRKRKGN